MTEDKAARVDKLLFWYEGNGNPGAGKRLEKIEKIIHGEEGECNAMTAIKKHIDWHEQASKKRWELTVGIALIFIGQIITVIIGLLK